MPRRRAASLLLSSVWRKVSSICLLYTSPDAPWAVALALAACARGKQEGFKLGNPGVLTELYPPFWVLYNNLPEPHMTRENKEVPAEPVKSRRRVITSAVAVPPPLEDEDY